MLIPSKKSLSLIFFIIFCSNTYAELTLLDRLTQFLRGRSDSVKNDQELKMPIIPKIDKDPKSLSSLKLSSVDSSRFSDLSTEDRLKYNSQFVRELFHVTRNEQLSLAQVADWVAILEQGAAREGIFRRIVLDDVYQQFEGFAAKVSPATLSFLQKYFLNYLGISIEQEVLAQYNIYTLKRITVEKTLELADAFLEPTDLFSWYGLLSAELANQFGKLFSGSIRKNSKPITHYKWAQEVPLQHLKSELIIKLQIVLNNLDQVQ